MPIRRALTNYIPIIYIVSDFRKKLDAIKRTKTSNITNINVRIHV